MATNRGANNDRRRDRQAPRGLDVNDDFGTSQSLVTSMTIGGATFYWCAFYFDVFDKTTCAAIIGLQLSMHMIRSFAGGGFDERSLAGVSAGDVARSQIVSLLRGGGVWVCVRNVLPPTDGAVLQSYVPID
jgi:hypothetical protein